LDRNIILLFKKHAEQYEKKEEQKRGLKAKFFRVAVASLGLLIVTSCAIAIAGMYNGNLEIAISGALAGLVQVLVAVIKIPSLIAEYLFNKDEEKQHIELAKEMLKQNIEWHKFKEERS